MPNFPCPYWRQLIWKNNPLGSLDIFYRNNPPGDTPIEDYAETMLSEGRENLTRLRKLRRGRRTNAERS